MCEVWMKSVFLLSTFNRLNIIFQVSMGRKSILFKKNAKKMDKR